MVKRIIAIVLFIFSKNVYSQLQNTEDYIITISNDTIQGSLRNVNFFQAMNIRILTKEGRRKYNIKELKELQVKGERYIRIKITSNKGSLDSIYSGRFIRPLIERGEIRVFQSNKSILLNRNKSIFNKKGLKYYADDYPATAGFLKQKSSTDSLWSFIKGYNSFSEQHPNSQCFAEKAFYYKKFFNPQMAINFVGVKPAYGYLGAELGVNKVFTLNPRLSYVVAVLDKTNGKPTLVPFAELGVKYYLFNEHRIKKERSTFLYSGTNFSLTYMQPLQENIIRALRIEVGFKAVSLNRFYSDYSIGSLYSIENAKTQLWVFVGFGYILW